MGRSDNLTRTCQRVRQNLLRSIYTARSGHPGGSLSCVEILVSLYFKELKPQPYHSDNPERDIFILSKGHACPALYAVFAELGIIEEAELSTLRKLGSRLQGHPAVNHLPAVETSTGSLGQGLSVAVGMATGFKLKGSVRRVYCLVGDGDMHEGMAIEAARFAGYNQLSNLCVIWDRNLIQSDRYSIDFINHPLQEFRNCGWHVEPVDGHDLFALESLYNFARHKSTHPVLVVAMTKKGQGVSYMKSDPNGYHGSLALSDGELQIALEELNEP